jgi:hypothetical protein
MRSLVRVLLVAIGLVLALAPTASADGPRGGHGGRGHARRLRDLG